MLIVDLNVLINAHRSDTVDHPRFRRWLEDALAGQERLAIAELVLSGVVRIVTNRRIFIAPSSLTEALGYCRFLLDHPNTVVVRPAERHWEIFDRLCRRADARGDLVPDAYLAALAIEHGCELITLDRDFARFPGLRWRHPF